jgi:DNA (cytosine-5)-methyltransferase 1
LVELGYGFAYRVLDAQHFGVPQRRRRVFVVACLGDWRAAAEVLSLREGLRGYLETGNKKRKGVAADAGASVEAGCWWDGGQVSQTLDAVLAKGQTMPEKNRFPAVLTPLTYDMKQHHNPQPSENVQLTTKNCAFVRGDTPLVQPTPFRKSKRACSTTDNETWVPADASNTLNNSYPVVPLDGMNLLSRLGPCGEEHSLQNFEPGDPSFTLKKGGNQHGVLTPMAVRRLTPNECYRLQGFPDNWGRIPWKGKPAEECPDGPQYKACGNSMAVPVMRWIGERIAEVDAKYSCNKTEG